MPAALVLLDNTHERRKHIDRAIAIQSAPSLLCGFCFRDFISPFSLIEFCCRTGLLRLRWPRGAQHGSKHEGSQYDHLDYLSVH
jgi:hypothetical protein